MKKSLLAALVLAAVSLPVFAGGTTGADILKVPSALRSVGMGGTGGAVLTDVTSMLVNPAAMAYIENRQASYMHIFDAALVRVENAGYAQFVDLPFAGVTAGASVVYRHMDAIDNPDAKEGPVNFYDYLLSVSVAAKMKQFLSDTFEGLRAGITVKLVQETIGQLSATAICGDAGLTYDIKGTGLRLAASVQNAGTGIKFISEESPLPLTLSGGLAHSFSIDKDNVFTSALSCAYDIYDYPRISVGFEDKIVDVFFLRAGYDQPADTRSPAYASLGAGISITQFDVNLSIDYVYRPALFGGFNAMTNSHFVQAVIKL